MVLFINPGGSSKYANGESFVVASSNTEVAMFKSLDRTTTSIRLSDASLGDDDGNLITSSHGKLMFASGSSNAPTTIATLVGSNATARMGINTVTPNFTVDVSGDVNIQGQLRFNGALFVANLVSGTTPDGKEATVFQNNVLLKNINNTRISLYAPDGDCLIGGNGVFGTSVSAPIVNTKAFKTVSADIAFDGGVMDTSYATSAVDGTDTIASIGNGAYVAYSYSNHVATASTNFGRNISITSTQYPSAAFSYSNSVFAGNTEVAGVNYIANAVASSSGTQIAQNGYVVAFKDSTLLWNSVLRAGNPSSVTLANSNFITTTGTFTSGFTIVDPSGSFFTPTQPNGAFLATFNEATGALFSAVTLNGYVRAPIVQATTNSLIWGGSFSNVLSGSYILPSQLVTSCNAIYTSSMSLDNATLTVSVTCNQSQSNVYTQDITSVINVLNQTVLSTGVSSVPTIPPPYTVICSITNSIVPQRRASAACSRCPASRVGQSVPISSSGC